LIRVFGIVVYRAGTYWTFPSSLSDFAKMFFKFSRQASKNKAISKQTRLKIYTITISIEYENIQNSYSVTWVICLMNASTDRQLDGWTNSWGVSGFKYYQHDSNLFAA